MTVQEFFELYPDQDIDDYSFYGYLNHDEE